MRQNLFPIAENAYFILVIAMRKRILSDVVVLSQPTKALVDIVKFTENYLK